MLIEFVMFYMLHSIKICSAVNYSFTDGCPVADPENPLWGGWGVLVEVGVATVCGQRLPMSYNYNGTFGKFLLYRGYYICVHDKVMFTTQVPKLS